MRVPMILRPYRNLQTLFQAKLMNPLPSFEGPPADHGNLKTPKPKPQTL